MKKGRKEEVRYTVYCTVVHHLATGIHVVLLVSVLSNGSLINAVPHRRLVRRKQGVVQNRSTVAYVGRKANSDDVFLSQYLDDPKHTFAPYPSIVSKSRPRSNLVELAINC
eukprot:GFKZ01009890.1.p1 GENE.GFKZ01009890.1~~GFKZ01009890.1.p1  ORF type:complete len:111 (+),score=2.02 GFKZ01009890.1:149-481(+)